MELTPLLTILVLSALSVQGLVFLSRREIDKQWNTWKIQHRRAYEGLREEAYRKSIFTTNLRYITGQRRRYLLGLESYATALNQFADMTRREFVDQFLGTKPQKRIQGGSRNTWKSSEVIKDLPDSIDWREKDLVTEVKNQGNCGSCWAFSATGALEGAMAKKTGKLLSLSEQQLVDCTRSKHGNDGCNGGYMSNAFKYLENHTIETEDAYPYHATDGECKYNESLGVGGVKDIGDIPEGNETALMEASATVGPISVAIDASALGFMFYRHGIYKSHWCSATFLNHGVLLIGYGKLDGKPYWLVKNSWGTKWGMKGYVMMAKDYHNMCGIASLADYPVV